MKVYRKIVKEIIFIDEESLKNLKGEYEILDTIYYDDGNVVKVEIVKSERTLKGYEHLNRY